MALPIKQHNAITDMAGLLYDFLPGSGHKTWKGHTTFKTVAEQTGVPEYCQEGSKRPMIIALLSKTLEYKRGRFESLIMEIIRAGIDYRKKNNNPIKRIDIETLNGYLVEVGFKFPELWDEIFLSSLSLNGSERAAQKVDNEIAREQQNKINKSDRSKNKQQIKEDFFMLDQESTPQNAGFKFEKILNKLFEIEGLQPRKSFRIEGEQIDGSIELDNEIYLIEAKWQKKPISEADLLIFRGKIEGKSEFTRGIFISLHGITEEARTAIVRGKSPSFFVIDGYDLTQILSEQIDLKTFLRKRFRILAEEGNVTVNFLNLLR